MAVDGAPDATTPAVAPSAAPPDPESLPAPTDTSQIRIDTGDSDVGVRDPAALERSREAMGYRVRLREAEERLGERDAAIGALRSEVDRLHRAEAERLAASAMATPADLWLVTDLADLRADDGRLDSEKVKAKVDAVVAEDQGHRGVYERLASTAALARPRRHHARPDSRTYSSRGRRDDRSQFPTRCESRAVPITGMARRRRGQPAPKPVAIATRPVPVHVARTVEFFSPAIVRAADAPPRRR